MHRFFCPHLDVASKIIRLGDKKEIHHIKNVLRLKKGDGINLFDGRGGEVSGQILSTSDNLIEVEVKKSFQDTQNKKSIILACAIPKKAKFEFIIEKCTELGVDEIIPLKTKRTEFTLSAERLVKKTERFQTVAVNAAKQCQRKTVPKIYPLTTLPEALQLISKNDAAFIPCLFRQQKTIVCVKPDINSSTQRIFFFIGPEGDFTEDEVSLAVQHGCIPLSLGETTLKVDTAAMVVVAFSRLYLLS